MAVGSHRSHGFVKNEWRLSENGRWVVIATGNIWSDTDSVESWADVNTAHQEQFSNVLGLADIILSLPAS